ncbi:hypothetical protein GSI_09931 [Ganoderma sinense ZZ0214-1]|uniref:Uncharacterized protein n=1 Tax=Ganoderma sinense ZZ0214-1 TaxID=1077348 RepID=A0A2G8S2L9_9APHY|nr:hypothetical protein GSI_09931 [Ganoderma sinense ZZ0214-1]
MGKNKRQLEPDREMGETDARPGEDVAQGNSKSHSGLETGVKIEQEKGESTITDSQDRERKLETAIQKAFIGFTVLDIVNTPFPDTQYEFGTWNGRPVVDRAVVGMVRSFREDGKMPEKATISIGIEKSWIDLTSTSKQDLSWSDIPRLRWTQAVEHAVVQFFGGRHRMKACIMWANVLEDERTKVKQKLERLKKSGGQSTSEDEVLRLEEWLSRLDKAIQDAHLWVCRVYVLSELSNECQLHLSKNEVRPSRQATADEKMFMSRLELLNAMASWQQKNPLTSPPDHGTKTWREDIYNVAFSEADRRAPYMFMFTNPHAFKVLGSICSFSYLRNGKTITLNTLSRALRPISRASHSMPVPAAGFLWGWMIRRACEELALIASAVSFPKLGLDVDGDGRVLEHMRLLMKEDPLPEGVKDVQVVTDTRDLILRWTTRDNVRDVVWSGATLEAVDEEYIKHFRPGPALYHFGDDEAPEWVVALQEYKATIGDILKIMWTTKLQDATLITPSESGSPDAIALENAYDKLQWAWTMREVGGVAGCDMPLPTKSFLQDLLCRLEDCALGFEWLVRSVDGLCDSEIRLIDLPTFDYISHLVTLLSCERLFVPGDRKEDQSATFQKTFRSSSANHALFEWSMQDRERVAAAAQWIKQAWAADESAEREDALANRLCKSIAHLNPDALDRVPGLAMLYRTSRSWWTEVPRSIPEEAWMYAYQCVIGLKLWAETSGRILRHSSGRTLRDELGEYLSMWAQPRCQESHKSTSNGEWVFWDSLVFEGVMAYGSELGLPACEVQGRGWVERQRQHRQASHHKDVQSIVTAVRKLKCAKGDSGHLYPWVRRGLETMCEAFFDNADRIEFMELHPDTRLYVPPNTRTAQFSIDTLDFGPEDEDDPDVFRTMEEFCNEDPVRYAEFKKRAKRGANKASDFDSLRPQQYNLDESCSESEPSSDYEEPQSTRSLDRQHTQDSTPHSHADGSNTSTGDPLDSHHGNPSDAKDEDELAVRITNFQATRTPGDAHNSPTRQEPDSSSPQVRGSSARPEREVSSGPLCDTSRDEDQNGRCQARPATVTSEVEASSKVQLSLSSRSQHQASMEIEGEGSIKIASQGSIPLASRTTSPIERDPSGRTGSQMPTRLEHETSVTLESEIGGQPAQTTLGLIDGEGARKNEGDRSGKVDKDVGGEEADADVSNKTHSTTNATLGDLPPLVLAKPPLARARGRSGPLRIQPVRDPPCKNPTPPAASTTAGMHSSPDQQQDCSEDHDSAKRTASGPDQHSSSRSRDTDQTDSPVDAVSIPSSPGIPSPVADLWNSPDLQMQEISDDREGTSYLPMEDFATQDGEGDTDRVQSHRHGKNAAASTHAQAVAPAMRRRPNNSRAESLENQVNQQIKRRQQTADLSSSQPPPKKPKTQPAAFTSFQFHDDHTGNSGRGSQPSTSQPRNRNALAHSLKKSGFTKQELKSFEML